MLRLLDIFFTVFHICLIVFNLFGWVWPQTRKLHLLTVAVTLASWFILGIWHGWGYCPFTEWHWRVKSKLGEQGLPSSFITYFANKITGRQVDPHWVDRVTLWTFLSVVVLTVYINFLKKKKLC